MSIGEPGDRAAGMPVDDGAGSGEHSQRRVSDHHRCLACGHEKVNMNSSDDRFETLLAIVRQTSDRLAKE